MANEEMMLTEEAEPIEAAVVVEERPDNLALILDDATLAEIGNRVVEDYNADLRSRAEWELRVANWIKLFSGHRDPKTFPWKDCSNVHLPLVAIACLQFQARAYDALVPAKEVAKCLATDGKAIDQATRCQKHLNWQLYEEMEEWEEDMDVMLLALPMIGCEVKKTYYDKTLGRNVSRRLGIGNFVAPYGCKRLEDTDRKTHYFYESVNDIKIKARDGVYVAASAELGQGSPASTQDPSPVITQEKDKTTGVTESGNLTEYPRLTLEQHRLWDIDGDGIQEPYIVTVDFDTRKVHSIQSAEYTDPMTGGIKTQEMFTAYTFIPNVDSWMGFGFGHLMEGLNEAANTALNQINDAGTLENVGNNSGLIAKRSGVKGKVEFQLGQFKEVDVVGDDINKAIWTPDFKGPSDVLFKVLGMLIEFAKEVSSVSDSILGKLPPSDTTATTMLAVMEQGLKVYSTIHKRLYRSLKKELRKVYRLNSLYLNELVYFQVQDSTGREMRTFQSGRLDYADAINVLPVADPTITSRAERLIKAKSVYEIAMTNPMIQGDPEMMYEATYQMLVANEAHSIADRLKKPEPQEPPDYPPMVEEAMWLSEKSAQVLPQQDHQGHYESHMTFMNSSWAEMLTPQGKKLAEAHIRETLSALYMAEQQMIQAMQGGMIGGGINAAGMAGMGAERREQAVPTGIAPEAEGLAGGQFEESRLGGMEGAARQGFAGR